jgi:two-component system, NtrC family, sensor histidine kinase KinB
MGSLKQKLAFSYGLLIIILLAVSAWGVYHFVRLGRAVDVILVDNYKSILAAENMKEALERQDSSAMFFLAGHTDKARQQFAENAARFSNEFQITENNVTEKGEDQIIADINSQYAIYKQSLEGFINQSLQPRSAPPSDFYFNHLEPAFLALKNRIDDLLHLNQQAMLRASERATAEALRAEISTAIVAIIGFVSALVFAWKFTAYIVDPVSVLATKAKSIGEGDFDQRIQISAKDEIGILAAEFNRMAARLRDMRKSDYWRMLIEQKKSDAVIDSLYEPVIVTDALGHITKLNQAAKSLFKNPHNEANDEDDFSLSGFTSGDRIIRAMKEAVAMQRPVANEGEAALVPIKIGQEEKSFRLRATPMRDAEGRLIGAVILLEDVTEMREVDRLKSEFISVASAKFRAPLQELQLALHTLVEGYTGELTGQQLDMLLAAHQNAEQLDEIMDDLLELAQIESGARKLVTERLRPIELARAAVERFQSTAEAKHIKLENKVWSDMSWVIADKQAMKRIFDNLLSNAIRHTERDGQIVISAEERSGRIFFSVSDTGEGIPEQYLPTLFARFVRVKEKSSGGTGLGLALVKRLVEVQGGQISVESQLGERTTFTFTLPIGGPASLKSLS